MKVGDLVSWKLFVGPYVDDIGLIVYITDTGSLDSKIGIAWLGESRVREHHLHAVKQDMALGVLAVLRQS
jgi:hypothetical protein